LRHCARHDSYTQMTDFELAVGISPAAFALAALLTFGSAAIRGLTGFGMAIILVPLLGLLMRPDDAVVTAIYLQLLIGPVGIGKIVHDADHKSAIPIAIIAMLATPIGVWWLAHTAPDQARLIIAGIAVGAFLITFVTRAATQRPGPLITLSSGFAAGVLTGFAAMPGPPVVPYYLREAFNAQMARASMMLVFFGTSIAGTLATALIGLGSVRLAWIAVLLFLPMLFGNWLGGRAFGKVPDPVWRTIVAVVLAVAGVTAVLRAL
jgi:uncharacterized protein